VEKFYQMAWRKIASSVNAPPRNVELVGLNANR
jgi:hypothetical protein